MIKKYMVYDREETPENEKYPEVEFNLRLRQLGGFILNDVTYFNVPFDEIASFVSHMINTQYLQPGVNRYILQYVDKDRKYTRCISSSVSLEYEMIDHLAKYPFKFELHKDVIEHYNEKENNI